FAASAITSSLFLTALAPNLLTAAIVQKSTGITIGWWEWLRGFLPAGLALTALAPWLVPRLPPPEGPRAPEGRAGAAGELAALGPPSRREAGMAGLALVAIVLWIAAGRWLSPTAVALGVVVLMVIAGVVSWEDVLGHRAAWNMLVWFGTLVTLADG